MKKLSNFLFTLAVFISIITLLPYTVKAEKKPTLDTNGGETIYLYKTSGNSYRPRIISFDVKGITKESQLTDLKSTNKNMQIIKVSAIKKRWVSIDIVVKKPGRTKISCKATVNGKKYNLSAKITAKSITHPLASVKIGGTDYTKAIKQAEKKFIKKYKSNKNELIILDLKLPTERQDINVELGTGWEFGTSSSTPGQYDDGIHIDGENIENGQSVNLQKDSELAITAHPKKSSVSRYSYVTFCIYIN